jgi:hypothetical protein
MDGNSSWQNRLGTVRTVALVVLLVIVGIAWYIRR